MSKENDFYQKRFDHEISNSLDFFRVRKSSGSDWSEITHSCNGKKTSTQIRNFEQLEQLHFLIGQMIGKS